MARLLPSLEIGDPKRIGAQRAPHAARRPLRVAAWLVAVVTAAFAVPAVRSAATSPRVMPEGTAMTAHARTAPDRSTRHEGVVVSAVRSSATSPHAMPEGTAMTAHARAAPDRSTRHEAVVVSAVFADGYAPGDADEAVQIWNTGGAAQDIGGWSIHDGEGGASLPASYVLAPGHYLWLARDGAAFARSFGRAPDLAIAPSPGVTARLVTTAGGPRLANAGDEVRLSDASGRVVDVVAYGSGGDTGGWRGPRVRAYDGGIIRSRNQVLYRKLEPGTGRPIADRDAASDWASDPGDVALGRRARFPGWDLEDRAMPVRASGRARLEVAVAPDALYDFLVRHLSSAQRSIDMAVYTLEHPGVAEAMARRARAGVSVRVMVDGSPVGGIDMNQRWCLTLIHDAGGRVFWHDDGGDVRARYRSAHAKLVVVDRETVLVGSENPSLGSAPDDARADGTSGRRGVYVATDLSAVVAWAEDLLASDLDARAHVDVRPFQRRDPDRGAPHEDFVPSRESGGTGYEPIAPHPLALEADLEVTLLSAPENALTPDDGLLGLLAAAGPGDTLRVEQLDEPLWWGDGPDEGERARNPRVVAYEAAARRGARVLILLDGYFDDPAHWNANVRTIDALNGVARREGLDLQARLGNPAGRGLHNKMVLAHMPATAHPSSVAQHWVHVGSLNGSEVAHKVNREVAVQIQSAAAHDYLTRVFAWDWAQSHRSVIVLPYGGR